MSFDYESYEDFPHLSRDGIKSDNGRTLTQGLFIETCIEANTAFVRYTLREKEYEWEGKLLPSAMQIYIASESEYDGMRRIVGSKAQWDHLKSLKWFQESLAIWQYEQEERQKEIVRDTLKTIMFNADKDATAVSAAKAYAAMLSPEQKKAVGRPVKAKETEPSVTNEVQAAMDRVVNLRGK